MADRYVKIDGVAVDYIYLDSEIKNFLDGYFGERLEDSEDEKRLYKHLYKPLSDMIKKRASEPNDDY